MGDWYYIGHYGQLGPLTREQIEELVEGGVIARDTYIWRGGMEAWLPAERVPEIATSFRSAPAFSTPPPPPTPQTNNRLAPPVHAPAPPRVQQDFTPMNSPAYYPTYGGIRSDRSRTAAGILQLFLPGVGRMYLGYTAYGVLQLLSAMCFIGFIWSFIDGIIILAGGIKLDGFGRHLND